MSQGVTSITQQELEQEAQANKAAGANLCVIWKSGGRVMVQALIAALKATHPKIAKALEWAVIAIDIICP